MRGKLVPLIMLAILCALIFASLHDLAFVIAPHLKPHFGWMLP